jgi:tRNA pseudouridine13 synthase
VKLNIYYTIFLFFIFKIIIDGAYLGLVLEFSLPASSYATMALREIIKMDMSAEFQSSLNDAGSAKHTAPAATTATTATADANNENVFNEPEVKRIKLEPNADPAPPAVGIESFECPDTKKIKQEPDADPAPPAVGIESFECPETKKIKQEPGVTSDEKL